MGYQNYFQKEIIGSVEKTNINTIENEHREFWRNVNKLIQEGFEEGLKGNTKTSTPNPIYIPKHVQHRRKGRK